MNLSSKRVVAATMGICAVLLVVSSVSPVVFLDATDSPLGWVTGSSWALLTVTAFAFVSLIPFVLVAIYGWHADEMGVLGLVGLVVSLVGAVVYLGLEFDKAFVWPVLAAQAPELIDFNGPMFRDPGFGFVHLWMGPTFSVGFLLFGIALFRARVFPRAASVLFVLGVMLSAGGVSPPFLIRAIGGLLGGPAIGWMAWVVLHRNEECPNAG